MRKDPQRNIVLTGMPGAGKSTVGVILAKVLMMGFIDTDLVIQERTGLHLQDIIDRDGPLEFMRIEEAAVLSLMCRNTVIATGGSVVLSPPAMEHLKANGTVVYLKVPCEEIEKRLGTIAGRGIVLLSDKTLRSMYNDRVLLYERYADLTIDCAGQDFENVVQTLLCHTDLHG
jgi:shikimate kinase